jgi:glyoxylase-like metal-dependent hydrolase (beta-lactamase superfamily II)
VLTIKLGASNVYLISTGSDYVAIDAGPDFEGASDSARAQMAAAGIEPRAVGSVFVTHGHPDHCGLSTWWQDEAGAEVWVPAGDLSRVEAGGRDPILIRELAFDYLAKNGVPADLIARTRSRPAGRSHVSGARSDAEGRLGNLRSVAPEHGQWPAPLRATPATANRLIEEYQSITIGALHLQPIICPGHTPASTVFLDEGSGDLFTGDHVLERIAPTPGIHFNMSGNRFRSLPDFMRSLQTVRSLSPRRVLPGHGAPFTDLAGAVDRTVGVFDQRAKRVLRKLVSGPASAYELALRLYPHLRPSATWLVMAEIIGLLDLLEERGQVAPLHEDTLSYRAT